MIDAIEQRLVESMGDAFAATMSRAIGAFSSYREIMPLVERSYTRTLLHRTSEFELVAMLWAPGSASPIHDHGASRCWVVGLEGAIDVENFDRLDDREAQARLRSAGWSRVAAGDLDHRLNWREMHRVRNTGERPAYTLQLYAEPLASYTIIVNERSGACGTLTANVDASFSL